MEEDELILDRVSLTRFDETPAHIAAMRGHVDFMRVLLSRKPKLASDLDLLGRSPLHVACAEGHVDIVHELLGADGSICGVRDGDGRTPLHLAAAKGRLEVLREVFWAISSKAESTREKLQLLQGGGESVLHLCVKYSHLEALQLVVEWMRSIKGDDGEHDSIINSKDRDGNTVLHLAAALKQMETTQYLLQVPSVIAARNTKNENGFTALDVLEVYPIRDLKYVEIRDILLLAGVQRARGGQQLLGRTLTDQHLESPTKPPVPTPTTTTAVLGRTTTNQLLESSPPPTPPVPTLTTTVANTISRAQQLVLNTWKMYFKIDDKWLEEARGNLIMSASVIAAMAFQGALSPPGGVWQDYNNGTEDNGSFRSNKVINRHPGTSIVMLIHTIRFFAWLVERRPGFFQKRSITKLLKCENLECV